MYQERDTSSQQDVAQNNEIIGGQYRKWAEEKAYYTLKIDNLLEIDVVYSCLENAFLQKPQLSKAHTIIFEIIKDAYSTVTKEKKSDFATASYFTNTKFVKYETRSIEDIKFSESILTNRNEVTDSGEQIQLILDTTLTLENISNAMLPSNLSETDPTKITWCTRYELISQNLEKLFEQKIVSSKGFEIVSDLYSVPKRSLLLWFNKRNSEYDSFIINLIQNIENNSKVIQKLIDSYQFSEHQMIEIWIAWMALLSKAQSQDTPQNIFGFWEIVAKHFKWSLKKILTLLSDKNDIYKTVAILPEKIFETLIDDYSEYTYLQSILDEKTREVFNLKTSGNKTFKKAETLKITSLSSPEANKQVEIVLKEFSESKEGVLDNLKKTPEASEVLLDEFMKSPNEASEGWQKTLKDELNSKRLSDISKKIQVKNPGLLLEKLEPEIVVKNEEDFDALTKLISKSESGLNDLSQTKFFALIKDKCHLIFNDEKYESLWPRTLVFDLKQAGYLQNMDDFYKLYNELPAFKKKQIIVVEILDGKNNIENVLFNREEFDNYQDILLRGGSWHSLIQTPDDFFEFKKNITENSDDTDLHLKLSFIDFMSKRLDKLLNQRKELIDAELFESELDNFIEFLQLDLFNTTFLTQVFSEHPELYYFFNSKEDIALTLSEISIIYRLIYIEKEERNALLETLKHFNEKNACRTALIKVMKIILDNYKIEDAYLIILQSKIIRFFNYFKVNQKIEEVPVYVEFREYFSSVEVNASTWLNVHNDIEQMYHYVHLFFFPEKALDVVYDEFSKFSEDVKFPMPKDELNVLIEQYKIISNFQSKLGSCSDHELQTYLDNCLPQIAIKENLQNNQLFLLAIVRQAYKNHFKFYPYNTQMMNILAFINDPDGKRIAQIKTGEGKSTIITILAFYYALQGRNIQIVTSNRELAKRDCEEFSPFITKFKVNNKSLKLAYLNESTYRFIENYGGLNHCSITWGTAYAYEFYYLYMNLDKKQQLLVFDLVIIDEIDDMFFDRRQVSARIADRIPTLDLKIYEWVWQHFVKKEMTGNFELLRQELKEKFQFDLSEERFKRWESDAMEALGFKNGIHYVIDNKKIIIVDYLYTGQLQENMRWHHAVHTFVEVKEKVPVQAETTITASISHRDFFLHFKTLFGVSGTIGDRENRRELKSAFGANTHDSPPYRPSIKKPLEHILVESIKDQNKAILKVIHEMKALGRPVLLFCETINKTKEFEKLFSAEKLGYKIYNDFQEDKPIELIKAAGQSGNILVATNIAGRGAHIPLDSKSVFAGGLHVILTCPALNERVEFQAWGRSGRQGEPGSYQYILCHDQIPPEFSNIKEWLAQRNKLILAEQFVNEKIYELQHIKFLFLNLYFNLPNFSRDLEHFHEAWRAFYTDLDTLVSDTIEEINHKKNHADTIQYYFGFIEDYMLHFKMTLVMRFKKFWMENQLHKHLANFQGGSSPVGVDIYNFFIENKFLKGECLKPEDPHALEQLISKINEACTHSLEKNKSSFFAAAEETKEIKRLLHRTLILRVDTGFGKC